MQKFYNAKLYTEDFKYEDASFTIGDDGLFCDIKVKENMAKEGTDLKGMKVLPMCIDIHTHGAMDFDFSDMGKDEDIIDKYDKAIEYYHKHGVCPLATTLTIPYEQLEKIVKNADDLIGIYLEGPFISKEKKGAQNESYIKEPDIKYFEKLFKESNGKIKVVTIAPEKNGAMEFIKEASKICTVSIAHTNCDYDIASKAFASGSKGVTHLFNAMNGIHHRMPGPIIAAYENKDVMVELISDGYHIHKSVVKYTFDTFGKDRVVLISDSLRCLGMNDGEYEIGGLKAILKDNVARLEDGTIAGSATNLYECMKKAISFGVMEEDAIRAATYNPAKHINVLDKYGSIKEKKVANFIIADDKLDIKDVYMGGKKINV